MNKQNDSMSGSEFLATTAVLIVVAVALLWIARLIGGIITKFVFIGVPLMIVTLLVVAFMSARRK